MTEEVLEAYNGLIGNWDIETIISEIKNSWDREVMTDLFRISASLITTIESLQGINKHLEETLLENHNLALRRGVEIEKLEDLIESQKEEIERLQIDRSDWEEEYMSLKRRFEDLDKSALETLELLNGPNDEIESLKAITELAVKGLKEIIDLTKRGGVTKFWHEVAILMSAKSQDTLSEIERLIP